MIPKKLLSLYPRKKVNENPMSINRMLKNKALLLTLNILWNVYFTITDNVLRYKKLFIQIYKKIFFYSFSEI